MTTPSVMYVNDPTHVNDPTLCNVCEWPHPLQCMWMTPPSVMYVNDHPCEWPHPLQCMWMTPPSVMYVNDPTHVNKSLVSRAISAGLAMSVSDQYNSELTNCLTVFVYRWQTISCMLLFFHQGCDGSNWSSILKITLATKLTTTNSNLIFS